MTWSTLFSRETILQMFNATHICCIRSEIIMISLLSLFVEAFTYRAILKLLQGLLYA